MRWRLRAILARCLLAAAALHASPTMRAQELEPPVNDSPRSIDHQLREHVAELSHRLEQNPQDVKSLVARAVAAINLSDLESARKDVASAIEEDPANVGAWHCQGSIHVCDGRFADAVIAFEKAISLGSKSPATYFELGRALTYLDKPTEAIKNFTQALAADETFAEAAVWRGSTHDGLGNWEQAIADFDQAIKLAPHRTDYLARRGIARLEHGEVAEGRADLTAAIKLNPGDAGVDFSAVTGQMLDAEAMRHGETQVRQMLRDRPAMAEHVVEGDLLWTWTVRKFAGEDLGTPIFWNPASSEPFPACSEPPANGAPGAIRVRAINASTPHAFDRLWSCAVFELYNITSAREWEEIWDRVEGESISRDEYVRAMLNSEERAGQKTRAFYLTKLLPWRQSQKLEIGDVATWCWRFFGDGDPVHDASLWKDDPRWPFYEACYDDYHAETAFQRGEVETARTLSAAVIGRSGSTYPAMIAAAHLRVGTLDAMAGEHRKAIEAFNAGLAADASNVPLLIYRGYVWTLLDEFDKSLNDYTEAIRLDPQSARARSYRAAELERRGEVERAMEDLNAAILAEPAIAEWHSQRGLLWGAMGKHDKAIADLSKAIEIEPTVALTYANRAYAFEQQGEFEKAVGDYENAIRIDPNDAKAVSNLAWILATHPSSKIRNGVRALELATKACKLTDEKEPDVLDTLAAAYAEVGDFKNAVETERRAIALASDAAQTHLQDRLKLYEMGQPFRESE